MMKAALTLAGIAMLAAAPVGAAEQRVSGPASAIDGDSLKVGGLEVRLSGVDAPELKQDCTRGGATWKCGEDAAALLTQLVSSKNVECIGREVDEHGRLIAVCNSEGLDVGLVMIEAGLAVTRPNSPPAYIAAEALRQQNRIGLWGSEFQQPADWRAANPQAQPRLAKAPVTRPAQAARAGQFSREAELQRTYRGPLGCAIKGNRSRRGPWIYHLPGQTYYPQTKAEEVFCTEAEAMRAGYRRSKV